MSNSAPKRPPTTETTSAEEKPKPTTKRRVSEPISIADILRSPALQRPGVAIPSDARARDIVARLALSPVPDLIDTLVARSTGAPMFDAPVSHAQPVPHAQPQIETKEIATISDAPMITASELKTESAALLGKSFIAAEDNSLFGAPNFDAPVEPLQVSHEEGEADSLAIKCGAPNFVAPVLGRVAEDTEFDLHGFAYARSGQRSYQIQAATRIQDSFTSQEYRILEFLWHRAREVPGIRSLRLAGGGSKNGARILAAQAGIAYSTFQLLTKNIRDKFGLEIIQPGGNFCKLYAVYHFSVILSQQKNAGYGYFIKQNGGGRVLVNAEGQRCPGRSNLTVGELKALLDALKVGAPTPAFDAPKFGAENRKFNAPKFAAPLRYKNYTTEIKRSSSPPAPNIGAPKIIVDALLQKTGRTDAEAVRLLLKRCQEANPTVTIAEIARLISSFLIPRTSTNPTGLIISTLPKQCEAESIKSYREVWEQEAYAEAQRRRHQTELALDTARSILADPDPWDEDSINWAKQVISETQAN